MNVASLLQDSPSDDREQRLQKQEQNLQHHRQLHLSPPSHPTYTRPYSHSTSHPQSQGGHSQAQLPPQYPHSNPHSSSTTPTPPLYRASGNQNQLPQIQTAPPLPPPLYPRERDRERDRDRERERQRLPPPASLSFLDKADTSAHGLPLPDNEYDLKKKRATRNGLDVISVSYHPDGERELYREKHRDRERESQREKEKEWEREREKDRRRERHNLHKNSLSSSSSYTPIPSPAPTYSHAPIHFSPPLTSTTSALPVPVSMPISVSSVPPHPPAPSAESVLSSASASTPTAHVPMNADLPAINSVPVPPADSFPAIPITSRYSPSNEKLKLEQPSLSTPTPTTMAAATGSQQVPFDDYPSSFSQVGQAVGQSQHLLTPSQRHRSKPGSTTGRAGSRTRQHQQQSQFELDWEVRDSAMERERAREKEREKRLHASQYSRPVSPVHSSAPTPPTLNSLKARPATPIPEKPKPYHLGTYVYPASPFPLRSRLPQPMEREIHFTLYIPRAHLPLSISTTPQVWGGSPAHATGSARRIYTDDSSLLLILLHSGHITLSECRKARQDLKVTLGVVPKESKACPVRWVGCVGEGRERDRERDRVRSWSWGNGHDGGGVEVVEVQWVNAGTAHTIHHPNLRARLKDYAERRSALMTIPINTPYADYSPFINDDEVVSDVWRKRGPSFENTPLDPKCTPKPIGDSGENNVLLFKKDGRITFKYTATSLRLTLFPPPPPPPNPTPVQMMVDPSVYHSDRERPRKKRKLDSNGSGGKNQVEDRSEENKELVVEGNTGELLVFRPTSKPEPSSWDRDRPNDSVTEKWWDVWIEGLRDDVPGDQVQVVSSPPPPEDMKKDEAELTLPADAGLNGVKEGDMPTSKDDTTSSSFQEKIEGTQISQESSDALAMANEPSSKTSHESINGRHSPTVDENTSPEVSESSEQETGEPAQDIKSANGIPVKQVLRTHALSASALGASDFYFLEDRICIWGIKVGSSMGAKPGIQPPNAGMDVTESGILFRPKAWWWRWQQAGNVYNR